MSWESVFLLQGKKVNNFKQYNLNSREMSGILIITNDRNKQFAKGTVEYNKIKIYKIKHHFIMYVYYIV